MIKLVIFDLDGTLLNSIEDIAAASNHALGIMGFPQHPVDSYYYFVGNGIMKLFDRALPADERTDDNILKMRHLFVPFYNEHSFDLTHVYEGIHELLKELQQRGVRMAVASNKYDESTKTLVERFFPEVQFAQVYGQREGVPVKPDPAVVNDILQQTAVSREDVLYVGDSWVDMETAANARVKAVGVTWGFRPRTELEPYNPCYIIDKPSQLLDLL